MTIPAAGERCQAAHPDDLTSCEGARDAVCVVEAGGEASIGCVHHAARLYASLERPRVYPAAGTDDAATETHQRAQGIEPFPWRHQN